MIAGPNALQLTAPFKIEGLEMRHEAEFVVRKGDRVPFVLTWYQSHHKDHGADDRRGPRASGEPPRGGRSGRADPRTTASGKTWCSAR